MSLNRILSALGSLVLLFALANADAVGDLQTKANTAWTAQLAKSTNCTKDKLLIRKEW